MRDTLIETITELTRQRKLRWEEHMEDDRFSPGPAAEAMVDRQAQRHRA